MFCLSELFWHQANTNYCTLAIFSHIGLVQYPWPTFICNAVLSDNSTNDSFSELHNGGAHGNSCSSYWPEIHLNWRLPQQETCQLTLDFQIAQFYFNAGHNSLTHLQKRSIGEPSLVHIFFPCLSIPLHPYFLEIVLPWWRWLQAAVRLITALISSLIVKVVPSTVEIST